MVREHAYGAGPIRQSPGLQRDASSAMSTENYHSNAALPPVKEYATEGKKKNSNAIAQQIQAEESDKQLSFNPGDAGSPRVEQPDGENF